VLSQVLCTERILPQLLCTEHVFQRSFLADAYFLWVPCTNTCFSAAVNTESVPLATVNMACVFSAALVRMLPQSAAAHIL
jgi:hypothetical protein